MHVVTATGSSGVYGNAHGLMRIVELSEETGPFDAASPAVGERSGAALAARSHLGAGYGLM
jgi:hypothetical protein